MPKNARFVYPRKVHVAIGPPIFPPEMPAGQRIPRAAYKEATELPALRDPAVCSARRWSGCRGRTRSRTEHVVSEADGLVRRTGRSSSICTGRASTSLVVGRRADRGRRANLVEAGLRLVDRRSRPSATSRRSTELVRTSGSIGRSRATPSRRSGWEQMDARNHRRARPHSPIVDGPSSTRLFADRATTYLDRAICSTGTCPYGFPRGTVTVGSAPPGGDGRVAPPRLGPRPQLTVRAIPAPCCAVSPPASATTEPSVEAGPAARARPPRRRGGHPGWRR